jgi:hypothetical protein
VSPSPDDSWDSEDFRADDPTLLDAMQRIFEFLVTDFGFELVYRTNHFKGHFLMYSGEFVRVTPQFDPEFANGDVDLYVEADLVPGSHVRYGPVSQILAAMAPDRTWTIADHPAPYSFAELESAYERWANGLRTSLAGVLRGEGLESIRWGRAW